MHVEADRAEAAHREQRVEPRLADAEPYNQVSRYETELRYDEVRHQSLSDCLVTSRLIGFLHDRLQNRCRSFPLTSIVKLPLQAVKRALQCLGGIFRKCANNQLVKSPVQLQKLTARLFSNGEHSLVFESVCGAGQIIL